MRVWLAAVAAIFVSGVALAETFERVEATNYTVFAPQGFDDNDEVIVVLDGYAPDTCHKLGKVSYTLDEEAQTISITQELRKFPGPCLEVLVPFTNELSLGVLPAGAFMIDAANGRIRQLLTIQEATSLGPDEHLYAPIESVIVQKYPGVNRYHAILNGRFTNTCMVWDELKVIDSDATIQVLPIMKLEERETCREIDVWFNVSVDLPANTTLGRHLVHVRSLNGKSQNAVFSVRPVTR